MGFWRGKKLGDTLVEVTIAIGIFSLVAIAVVSVVSNSTSGAQSNLENTVTREEIDAQAEAIRFIHDSYIMDTSESSVYKEIWDQIEGKAIEAKGAELEGIENYSPTSCEAPFKYRYNNKDYDYSGKAFVINYNALNTLDKNNIVKALDNTTYQESQTFPRIAYSTGVDSLSGENNLDGAFSKAEGIFVLAVRDPGSTYTSEAGEVKKSSAYVDFYIRTCWYAANANTPSTISTVIRLTDTTDEREDTRGYDSAAAIVYHQTVKSGLNSANGLIETDTLDVVSGHSKQLKTGGFARDDTTKGWSFDNKWCYDKDGKKNIGSISFPTANPGDDLSTICNTGYVYTAGEWFRLTESLSNTKYHFYEMLKQNKPYTVVYDANKENNGGVCQYYRGKTAQATDCQRSGASVNGGETYTAKIQSNTRNGNKFYTYFAGKDNSYNFVGWCTVQVGLYSGSANFKDLCEKSNGGTYYKGNGEEELKTPNPTPTEGGNTILYAMWQRSSISIKYNPGDHGKGSEKNFTEYGQGGDAPSHTIKAYNDSSIGYTPNNCYVFKRWKGSNGANYNAGDKITSSMTLTAEWDYNCYNVEYHANYDNGGSYGVAGIRVGTTHTVQGNMFTRQGYQWTGWKNASGTEIAVNSKISSNANTTYHLYAQWKKNECTLHDQHFGNITNTPGGYIFQYFNQVEPGKSSWGGVKAYAWTVPEGCGGTYQFEVWGARGGSKVSGNGGTYGGAGGFTTGYTTLKEGQTIYVVIGGEGTSNAGGFNGGGTGSWGGGGGATHIATVLRGNGELANYVNHQEEILIVAGGGGGGQSFSGWTTGVQCKGNNNGVDAAVGEAGMIELGDNRAYSKGGYGGGGNGGNGSNPNANAGEGLHPDCVNHNFAANGSHRIWPEAQSVYDCAEKFLYNAEGGQQNRGGHGGWGTDHYSPAIADGDYLAYGNLGDSNNYTQFGDLNHSHSERNWSYSGSGMPYAHDNIIGKEGSFGQGGSGGYLIYLHDGCNSSNNSIKNGVGRNCNFIGNFNNRYTIANTKNNEGLVPSQVTAPFNVDVTKFFPGAVQNYSASNAGGGGGWYGGGASGLTGCRPASGAGGSGTTKGLWNTSSTAGANNAYGSAVLRRIGN